MRALHLLPVLLPVVLLTSAFVFAPDGVVLRPSTQRQAPAPASFSHWQHDGLHCYRCHPAVFPRPAPVSITHRTMNTGVACGACHDGRRAPAIKSMNCEACHAR